MDFEHVIYWSVFLLWIPALVQGIASFADGIRFHRFIRRAKEEGPSLLNSDGTFKYHPRVTVIMPCKGVDEKLEHTVAMIGRQNYPDYEVLFAFESADDPAYKAVEAWTRGWTIPRTLVVAGLADCRSQKIHNLLAALKGVGEDREVLVFTDSDVEPDHQWLGYIVAPLQDSKIAAATGYRWYLASGGVAAGVRCAWNAATTVKLHDQRLSFCWGGSTAMRRETFESLEIARHWDRALSDDLQVTRAIQAAKMGICFVPHALVISSDATTLAGFLSFARRQLIITRICAPAIWRFAFLFCISFILGGTATFVLAVAAFMGWFGSLTAAWMGLAGWAIAMTLVGSRALMRQMSMRLALGNRLTWRDFCWDVLGTLTFAGGLHMQLFLASAFKRRFFWRNIEYEMLSPDETRIVRRLAST